MESKRRLGGESRGMNLTISPPSVSKSALLFLDIVHLSDDHSSIQVVLYDRPNVDDWITGCTLTFTDGSSVPVGALANDGSATLVTLPGSVVTSMIVVAVTSVGLPSPNIGLSEFKAFGTLCSDCPIGNTFGNSSTTTTTSGGTASGYDANANLARLGVARASSWPATQPPQRAIDGVISGYPRNSSAEWSTVSQTVGAWLNVSWDSYYLVDRIILHVCFIPLLQECRRSTETDVCE